LTPSTHYPLHLLLSIQSASHILLLVLLLFLHLLISQCLNLLLLLLLLGQNLLLPRGQGILLPVLARQLVQIHKLNPLLRHGPLYLWPQLQQPIWARRP
jgi:hypothetical protein